jgi:hypothetical protein
MAELLDFTKVGPNTDEYDRIKRVQQLSWVSLSQVVEKRGFRLPWTYGDSQNWGLIIAIPTENELTEFLTSAALQELAEEISDQLVKIVAFNAGFILRIEFDSDERVRSNEGWGFRIKGSAQPGREVKFIPNDGRLSRD